MTNIIEEIDRKINETRSLMHYYKKKTTPLDKAKSVNLENVLNQLKEERKKIKYY